MNSTKSKKKRTVRNGVTPKTVSDYFNPDPKTAAEAIRDLVLANRILSHEGILDHLGHVSVRNPKNPESFFISRKLSAEWVTKEDILEVDFDGRVLTRTRFTPYSETFIHSAIFEARPDVNSVIHAHPKELVILSVTDMPVKFIYHTSAFFHAGVPLFDQYDFNGSGMMINTREEGARVARNLGNAMANLMRGHGANVVGDNIPFAVRAIVELRNNVQVQLAAQPFGRIKTITEEEAKCTAQTFGRTWPRRAWNTWVAKVKQVMPDLKDY
jgi:3-hydroxy-2-methylpyridine-4,5-dicarboxylate 4-decarboxylase